MKVFSFPLLTHAFYVYLLNEMPGPQTTNAGNR